MVEMMTRQEAAKILQISITTLDRLRRSGQIAYIQRTENSRVWISKDAVEEYISRITRPAIPGRQSVNTYRKRRKK